MPTLKQLEKAADARGSKLTRARAALQKAKEVYATSRQEFAAACAALREARKAEKAAGKANGKAVRGAAPVPAARNGDGGGGGGEEE